MFEIVDDPRGYEPAPCPDCGAPRRVFGWACVDHDGRPAFVPVRVTCPTRCENAAPALAV